MLFRRKIIGQAVIRPDDDVPGAAALVYRVVSSLTNCYKITRSKLVQRATRATLLVLGLWGSASWLLKP